MNVPAHVSRLPHASADGLTRVRRPYLLIESEHFPWEARLTSHLLEHLSWIFRFLVGVPDLLDRAIERSALQARGEGASRYSLSFVPHKVLVEGFCTCALDCLAFVVRCRPGRLRPPIDWRPIDIRPLLHWFEVALEIARTAGLAFILSTST